MGIRKRLKKLLFGIIVIIALVECSYLFILPVCADKYIPENFTINNTNIHIENIKIKTHILPKLNISASKLEIKNFIDARNLQINVSLFDLLRKNVNINRLDSDNIFLTITYDKDGCFNFEKLFASDKNKKLNLILKNNTVNIGSYKLVYKDENLDKTSTIQGFPLVLNIKDKDNMTIKTKGNIISNQEESEFDIDLSAKLPLADINSDLVKGKCFIYNLDLDMIFPYLKKYYDKNIKKFSGKVKYIQLSDEDNKVVFNTYFSDLVFDKENWKNYVWAKGENIVKTSFSFEKDIINVHSFNYKADNIDIKADGTVDLEGKKINLDVNTTIEKSKAENIASILPPTLVPKYMTIEKIKNYGVYGDIEAEIQIKGQIPQPNITGYVKADNVHVLDKSLHKLHKGTVFIRFDKRILNMDILVNMFNNQKATVKGYVYMFRDGINNVTVKTTDNIDFPLAQKIIVPISKVFNFQLGPIPDMNIKSGSGIIDVNIKGNMSFVNIDGFSDFHNAVLSYNGLYGVVDKGKGRLDFKDDVISFKSEQAFVKSNPLSVEGRVKINDNLDFNISSTKAKAEDLLEIINNSTLLKDVKDGLKVITGAEGNTRLFVNLKAKIVPVPFGHPPLPPEEAFEDMKVKGSLYLFGDSCFIEGFKTPIESIKGIVDFTETVVDINNLSAVSGTSPVTIYGKIINDLKTKIPDVDLTVTSKSVNLKDTIRFLTKSYLYPENYPDLSSLYNIASKHDLYFKYKAKAVDFITDKAYAEMNFINDNEDNPIKAKSGRIILNKSTVTVDNVNASLYDSNLSVNGNVLRVDTINPIYNLKIQTDNFNFENLNDVSKITIMPDKLKCIIEQFKNFKGFSDLDISIDKNIFKGEIYVKNLSMQHKKTNIPVVFDSFPVIFKENKIIIDNMTAKVADMPLFGDFTLSDCFTKPKIFGYFTSKLTNNFIKGYLSEDVMKNISLEGDIGFSSKIKGEINNLIIEPKLVLNPDADITIGGINVGDVNEKREFKGKINILKDKILINDFNYTKYIASQNNKMNTIVFATSKGELAIKNGKIIPKIFEMKTNKNLPARILNVFLKTPVLTQGSFNCDIKYMADFVRKTSKITGNLDCRNLDIPLFDSIVKNIHLSADDNKINLSLFAFITDSKVNVNSIIKNNFSQQPQVEALNIYVDQIDRNKLFERFSQIHTAMNTNNKIKNMDLNGLSIANGHLEVKELLIKSLVAKNFTSDFNVDKNGIFNAQNMNVDISQGSIKGKMSYNLSTTAVKGDFELNNVDSNYIAETLFEGKNQIYGNANGKMYLKTKGMTDTEMINNLSGNVSFNISDGRMPKLGSLEYLLRASNILKSGLTGFTLNSILELLNLVKTGYFSNIYGSCNIENGIAKNIEIFSKGENMSLYIHGNYDIADSHADMEVLGKLSNRISTIFGRLGNTSLNTFFRLIPGISLLDFGRKDFIEDVEKIPSFTGGDYEARIFQAIINGNINESGYVQSFKWVKQ